MSKERNISIIYSCFFICLLSLRIIAGDNPKNIRAVRIATPPRIDGALDEEVWKQAEPATDFIQRDPQEGKPASERTEIRVLYDNEALYFGCMFYDSEPEKIVARLTRRDNEIESDDASIRIDSYHDHQTGFEFTFNAAGVKVDILQYDDANRADASWDPVWELETRITSQGWCAEIKIPFHILRYRSASDSTQYEWGINFSRYISRKQEIDYWAFTPKKQSGFISRFGHLVGLQNIPSIQQIELLPFILAKQQYAPATDYMNSKKEFFANAGSDLKYRLSSSFTIDATINPDFGQVEADPAVLNLSTFETFYPEKRPFFIEGTQIIRFTTFGDQNGPGMFYSRRIGRAISADEVYVPTGGKIELLPQHTTILGAAKISGKTNNGLSIGVLEAFTKEEKATVADSTGSESNQIVEPFAHYNVIRIKQDLYSNSNVGMLFTSVSKDHRNPAFTNGYDWNLKFDSNTYQLDGFFALSRTTSVDSDRVTGNAGKIQFGKIAGEHVLWTASLDWTAKKYNINDIGFFFRPNDWGPIASITYKEDVPAQTVRNYNINLFLHERSNFDLVNIIREVKLSSVMLFTNYWATSAVFDVDAGLYDDRESRGNGLYRKPTNYSGTFAFITDSRDIVRFQLNQQFSWDQKLKRQYGVSIYIEVKPISWMEWGIESDYQHIHNQEAWVSNVYVDGASKSIFADRNTNQVSATLRSTITFTRDLTLQLYGQIFSAQGQYEHFRQLISPTAFAAFDYESNPNFSTQSFNTNVVLRWEYMPGSTAYLVWSQARHGTDANAWKSFGQNYSKTFQIAPYNVLLLKVSYWLNM